MAEKHTRYRERRKQAGWKRVELMVPEEAVPWLQAYARALRDASALNLPLPGFDGMMAQREAPSGNATSAPAQEMEPTEQPAPRSSSRTQRPAARPQTSVADQSANTDGRHTPDQAKPKRPDFSGGLFGSE
ncbi:hypothetical protein [Amorphus orientalis]|uniref:Membrane protein n=1 Tax=Amorphus orientalis TaxID=649198 RepID=A0AAE3VMV6_9HYPH|nr:hypothetical protein [Amorphus orientalis]MDQ0314885.1 putative membrane protein [Amorphus orientalis]